MIHLIVPRSHVQRFTLRRHALGTYDQNSDSATAGEFIESAPVETTHKGSVQQVDPKEVQNLPSGMDPWDTWIIHSSTAEFKERTKNQRPDEAFFNDQWYTLISLDDYSKNSHTAGTFSRYDRTRS